MSTDETDEVTAVAGRMAAAAAAGNSAAVLMCRRRILQIDPAHEF